jgi:type IV pilus assembly protein PilE
MSKWIASRKRSSAGFTLVELMVAVVIASVLMAIAIPSYIDKVRQSRRTEAKTTLLDIAGREERFFNTSNTYSSLPSDVGYGAVGAIFPMTVGSGYYTVNVVSAPAAGAVPASYTITATPLGDQLKDAPCQLFQLTSLGVQSSTPNTTDCWK